MMRHPLIPGIRGCCTQMPNSFCRVLSGDESVSFSFDFPFDLMNMLAPNLTADGITSRPRSAGDILPNFPPHHI